MGQSAYNTEPNDEPAVQELLDDPIAQMLMAIDGVERQTLDPMLHEIMDKISRADLGAPHAAAHAEAV